MGIIQRNIYDTNGEIGIIMAVWGAVAHEKLNRELMQNIPIRKFFSFLRLCLFFLLDSTYESFIV